MHFASAFEGAACAQMPGCFRHMIRSGWCFAMANPCGEARTLASSRALFSRKASYFARCLDNFTALSGLLEIHSIQHIALSFPLAFSPSYM